MRGRRRGRHPKVCMPGGIFRSPPLAPQCRRVEAGHDGSPGRRAAGRRARDQAELTCPGDGLGAVRCAEFAKRWRTCCAPPVSSFGARGRRGAQPSATHRSASPAISVPPLGGLVVIVGWPAARAAHGHWCSAGVPARAAVRDSRRSALSYRTAAAARNPPAGSGRLAGGQVCLAQGWLLAVRAA
jgi:hypothetical protein